MNRIRFAAALLLFAGIVGAKELALTTSLASYVDAQMPTLLFFEPRFSTSFDERRQFEVGMVGQQALNSYLGFAIPKATALVSQTGNFPAPRSVYSIIATGLELDRWRMEGYRIRVAPALEVPTEITSWLTLRGRLHPFFQFNAYASKLNGATLPKYGLQERIILTAHYKRWIGEVRLIVEQAMANEWKNDYSIRELFGYILSQQVQIGFSHEWAGSVVDESTGKFQSLRIWDSQQSLVSAFLNIRL